MKLSLVVSTPQAKFSALALKDNLESTLRKVSEIGYDGVELAVRDPKIIDLPKITDLVEKLSLDVCAIGTGQAYDEEGLSFTHMDVDVRARAIQRIKEQTSFASRFKALVIIGLIRGRHEEKSSLNRAYSWLSEAMTECGQYAANIGVELVLEPLNRYETNLINSIKEGVNLIEELSLSNVSLLIDTFHMNIEEASINKSIEEAGKYIKHVHLADSNRCAPGYGHIDFLKVVKALEKVEYDGYLSAEILPLPDPDKAARAAYRHTRRILDDDENE